MKYKVGKSNIEGQGLFANKALKKNELIGLAHLNDEPTETVGKYHNHSNNPNAYSLKVKNKRFIYALRDLKPGEEITVDYRKQPELEQPDTFKKGGQPARAYYDDSRDAWVYKDGTVGPNGPANFQEGGEPKRKERFQPGTYDPNEMAGYIQNEEEVVVPGKASAWGKARINYKEKHPEEQFIERKKRQYLVLHPGLNKLAGISMTNFPADVEQNFRDEYNYKTNTAVVRKVGRQEGWNPNNRTEYVDDLNDTQRQIVSDSKYGSKLQPGYWARSAAGAQEMANFLIKQLPGTQGDVLQYQTPGLTKREQKEIAKSNYGALETFAPMDIPGVAIANYLKNNGISTGSDYKELPGVLSGEKMANVTDLDALALNPINWTIPGDIAGLAALTPKAISLAKNIPGLVDNTVALGIKGADKVLQKNAARFFNPGETMNLPVNITPERLDFLKEVEELKRTIAFDTTPAQKEEALRKLAEKSNVSDEVFSNVTGYDKQDLINNVKNPDSNVTNQLPAPPDFITIESSNIEPTEFSIAERDRLTQQAYDQLIDRGDIVRYELPEDVNILTQDDIDNLDPETLESIYGTNSREPIQAYNINGVTQYLTNSEYKQLVSSSLSKKLKNTETYKAASNIPKSFKQMFDIPQAKYADEYAMTGLSAKEYKSARAMHTDLVEKLNKATNKANVGDVITGSTNTSYNSYIPQMGYIFKNSNTQGLSEPIFLGYEPMNSLGFLTSRDVKGIGVDNEDVLGYLNNQLNTVQKRYGKNMYFKKYPIYMDEQGNIMLPQYGLKKLKDSKVDFSKKLNFGGENSKLDKFIN
jgi:hypothetical protein